MKQYDFNFNPNTIFRIYRADDYSTVEMLFVSNQSLLIEIGSEEEFNNFFNQLDEYCIKSYIKARVRRYNEED